MKELILFLTAGLILISSGAEAQGFQQYTLATSFWAPAGIHVTDMNADGHLDILAAAWNDDEISFWLNSGESMPQWERHLITDSLNKASFCSSGDVNSDGIPDVAASAWEPGLVLLFMGNSSGTWARHVISDTFEFAHEVHLVDINGDGNLDVLAAGAGDCAVAWWENNGSSPDLWPMHEVCSNMPGGRSVCWGDFDLDGDIDLAGCALDCDQVKWWENSGDPVPSWTDHMIEDFYNGAHMLRAGDVNSDGYTDLVGAAFINGRPWFWLNSGTTPVVWEEHQISYPIGLAMGVELADLNSDGLLDLAATSLNPNQISMWINNGESPSTWDKTLIDGTISGAWPLGAGDLNGDGELDLTAGANGANYIRWYANQGLTGISEPLEDDYLNIACENPVVGCTPIILHLSQPADLDLVVSDLSGRTVRNLCNDFKGAGDHWFFWDGVDMNGTVCGSGVYFIRAQASTGELSLRKVTLLN